MRVQVLGLGKQQAIDYSHDERVPALMAEEDDYVHFYGHKLGERCRRTHSRPCRR